jgi:hypothetical protein
MPYSERAVHLLCAVQKVGCAVQNIEQCSPRLCSQKYTVVKNRNYQSNITLKKGMHTYKGQEGTHRM